MRNILLFFIAVFALIKLSYSAEIYFPPADNDNWESVSPDELQWNTDKIPELLEFLEEKNSYAFIVLKDGKIVIEEYFGNFSRDSLWYWASAGKTLTAVTIGIAQEEGLLSINDKTSEYLGTGWTSLPEEKEGLITIRHQLTMTSGLDDGVDNKDCWEPECLQYLEDAGQRWAYHNAPYTLLEQVLESAAGQTYNQYFFKVLRNRIGMNGAWIKLDFNNVYYSSPIAMARFGILIQANGSWDGESIITDNDYFYDMTHKSQEHNESYGFLWWLNGYDSHMIPQVRHVFDGPLFPDMPDDAFAALGKNGQILCVVPSEGLVMVRMGNAPDDQFFVSTEFTNQIWQKLSPVISGASGINEDIYNPQVYPNPAEEFIILDGVYHDIEIINIFGNKVFSASGLDRINVSELPKGVYFITSNGKTVSKFLKKY